MAAQPVSAADLLPAEPGPHHAGHPQLQEDVVQGEAAAAAQRHDPAHAEDPAAHTVPAHRPQGQSPFTALQAIHMITPPAPTLLVSDQRTSPNKHHSIILVRLGQD